MNGEHDVLFIDDLARALRTSTRTIRRRLRAGAELPPQMRKVDNRHRWLQKTVDEWKARDATTAQGMRVVHGGRR